MCVLSEICCKIDDIWPNVYIIYILYIYILISQTLILQVFEGFSRNKLNVQIPIFHLRRIRHTQNSRTKQPGLASYVWQPSSIKTLDIAAFFSTRKKSFAVRLQKESMLFCKLGEISRI